MTSDGSKKPKRGEQIGDHVSIKLRGPVWWANYQLKGKQRRKSLKTSSKKEARRKAVKLEAELMEGRHPESCGNPKIKFVTDEYLKHLATEQKAKRTQQKCDLVVRRVLDLAARRGAKAILDINVRFFDAYRSERAVAGAKAKTVLNESVIVKQIVNYAISRDLINVAPLRKIKLKKVKPMTQPCWTRAEVNQILGAADDNRRPMLSALAETGMRVGELKHLTWDDVDFDNSVVLIREKPEWKPKTGDSRSIPMSKVLRELLQQLQKRGRWVFNAATSRRYPDTDRQFSERRLLQYLKRLLKKVKLKGHLHTFRHAFISNAVTHGIPEAIVRRWVGHVDAETMKLYTHIVDTASKDAMQKLANINNQFDKPKALEGPESKNGS